jgi:hypothetical protein
MQHLADEGNDRRTLENSLEKVERLLAPATYSAVVDKRMGSSFLSFYFYYFYLLLFLLFFNVLC